ncbi:O-antigen ligase family protein [Xanthobacter dioxanivorans]|uniref:O-antigen ligase family protein n=1 Tax=Xanthobacter dioxanivorans TaxID=2528964 RepID=A0A974PMG7_9HYPH|nr:O-antigen ligase family protein [Xanthobacter dioxanivorans]QRG05896.1 O-antigen ligase family protein [Xanthobacter dioxanivorans]
MAHKPLTRSSRQFSGNQFTKFNRHSTWSKAPLDLESQATGAPQRQGEMRLIIVQVGFAAAVIATSFGGMARLTDLAFTPLAVLIGLYLFFSSSPQYMAFCMWLWMLTPFVRRVVDFGIGFQPQSFVMLAPFAVSLICIITVFRTMQRIPVPYWLILIAVILGFLFGLVQTELNAVILGALDWIAPLFLAVHILAYPDLVKSHADRIFGAMTYGTLLMGAYGALQFFYLPSWDAFWGVNAAMASLGPVEAGSIRVFSTMNSPGVLALYLMSGLTISLMYKSKVKFMSTIFGLLSFMLTMVRSAWGGFFISASFVFVRAPLKDKLKYIVVFSFAIVASIFIFSSGELYDKFDSRFNTIFNLENDTSYRARSNFYSDMSDVVAGMVAGEGLGRTGRASKLGGQTDFTSFDSGVLEIMFTFGFFGVLVFIASAMILIRTVRASAYGSYASGAAAIAIATISQLIFLNVLSGPSGVIFHVFSALAMAHAASSTSHSTETIVPG